MRVILNHIKQIKIHPSVSNEHHEAILQAIIRLPSGGRHPHLLQGIYRKHSVYAIDGHFKGERVLFKYAHSPQQQPYFEIVGYLTDHNYDSFASKTHWKNQPTVDELHDYTTLDLPAVSDTPPVVVFNDALTSNNRFIRDKPRLKVLNPQQIQLQHQLGTNFQTIQGHAGSSKSTMATWALMGLDESKQALYCAPSRELARQQQNCFASLVSQQMLPDHEPIINRVHFTCLDQLINDYHPDMRLVSSYDFDDWYQARLNSNKPSLQLFEQHRTHGSINALKHLFLQAEQLGIQTAEEFSNYSIKINAFFNHDVSDPCKLQLQASSLWLGFLNYLAHHQILATHQIKIDNLRQYQVIMVDEWTQYPGLAHALTKQVDALNQDKSEDEHTHLHLWGDINQSQYCLSLTEMQTLIQQASNQPLPPITHLYTCHRTPKLITAFCNSLLHTMYQLTGSEQGICMHMNTHHDELGELHFINDQPKDHQSFKARITPQLNQFRFIVRDQATADLILDRFTTSDAIPVVFIIHDVNQLAGLEIAHPIIVNPFEDCPEPVLDQQNTTSKHHRHPNKTEALQNRSQLIPLRFCYLAASRAYQTLALLVIESKTKPKILRAWADTVQALQQSVLSQSETDHSVPELRPLDHPPSHPSFLLTQKLAVDRPVTSSTVSDQTVLLPLSPSIDVADSLSQSTTPDRFMHESDHHQSPPSLQPHTDNAESLSSHPDDEGCFSPEVNRIINRIKEFLPLGRQNHHLLPPQIKAYIHLHHGPQSLSNIRVVNALVNQCRDLLYKLKADGYELDDFALKSILDTTAAILSQQTSKKNKESMSADANDQSNSCHSSSLQSYPELFRQLQAFSQQITDGWTEQVTPQGNVRLREKETIQELYGPILAEFDWETLPIDAHPYCQQNGLHLCDLVTSFLILIDNQKDYDAQAYGGDASSLFLKLKASALFVFSFIFKHQLTFAQHPHPIVRFSLLTTLLHDPTIRGHEVLSNIQNHVSYLINYNQTLLQQGVTHKSDESPHPKPHLFQNISITHGLGLFSISLSHFEAWLPVYDELYQKNSDMPDELTHIALLLARCPRNVQTVTQVYCDRPLPPVLMWGRDTEDGLFLSLITHHGADILLPWPKNATVGLALAAHLLKHFMSYQASTQDHLIKSGSQEQNIKNPDPTLGLKSQQLITALNQCGQSENGLHWLFKLFISLNLLSTADPNNSPNLQDQRLQKLAHFIMTTKEDPQGESLLLTLNQIEQGRKTFVIQKKDKPKIHEQWKDAIQAHQQAFLTLMTEEDTQGQSLLLTLNQTDQGRKLLVLIQSRNQFLIRLRHDTDTALGQATFMRIAKGLSYQSIQSQFLKDWLIFNHSYLDYYIKFPETAKGFLTLSPAMTHDALFFRHQSFELYYTAPESNSSTGGGRFLTRTIDRDRYPKDQIKAAMAHNDRSIHEDQANTYSMLTQLLHPNQVDQDTALYIILMNLGCSTMTARTVGLTPLETIDASTTKKQLLPSFFRDLALCCLNKGARPTPIVQMKYTADCFSSDNEQEQSIPLLTFALMLGEVTIVQAMLKSAFHIPPEHMTKFLHALISLDSDECLDAWTDAVLRGIKDDPSLIHDYLGVKVDCIGINIDLQDPQPFMISMLSAHGKIRPIKALTPHLDKILINHRDAAGFSPLTYANVHQHLACCQWLIDAGANQQWQNPDDCYFDTAKNAIQNNDRLLLDHVLAHDKATSGLMKQPSFLHRSPEKCQMLIKIADDWADTHKHQDHLHRLLVRAFDWADTHKHQDHLHRLLVRAFGAKALTTDDKIVYDCLPKEIQSQLRYSKPDSSSINSSSFFTPAPIEKPKPSAKTAFGPK